MVDGNHQYTEWEGALGPQSKDEPLFYELKIKDGTIRLVGPSPGQSYEYEVEEFDTLVTNGEWVLATDDWENEVYRTPHGDKPY